MVHQFLVSMQERTTSRISGPMWLQRACKRWLMCSRSEIVGKEVGVWNCVEGCVLNLAVTRLMALWIAPFV